MIVFSLKVRLLRNGHIKSDADMSVKAISLFNVVISIYTLHAKSKFCPEVKGFKNKMSFYNNL